MSDALSTRRLVPILGAALLATMVPLPAVDTPKAPPASIPAKPKAATTAEVTTRDDAAAFRLLAKAQPIAENPEKATQAQLAQAARDLAWAAELEPDLDLQPWFHADQGSVSYARAKAKRGPTHRYFLEKANVQFKLAALTHEINVGSTKASEVTDYHAAGDATASFILYHVGLTEYELGRPSTAVFALDLLLAAAADHDLRRPEYVTKARALVAEVRRAAEKSGRWVPSPPETP